MKVDFSVREHELLVRLRLVRNSIKRVLSHVDKGRIDIPQIDGYSLIVDLNDIEELCDLNQDYFQMWKETEAVTMEVMKEEEDSVSKDDNITRIYKDLCHKCDEVIEYTDVFSCCPNCLTSFQLVLVGQKGGGNTPLFLLAEKNFTKANDILKINLYYCGVQLLINQKPKKMDINQLLNEMPSFSEGNPKQCNYERQ